MRNQRQRGDGVEETLQGNSASAASEPATSTGTTLPATESLPGDAGTGWDPWDVWQRHIEQPRRRRRVTTKQQD